MRHSSELAANAIIAIAVSETERNLKGGCSTMILPQTHMEV